MRVYVCATMMCAVPLCAHVQLLAKSKSAYEHVCVRCEAISHDVLQQAEDTKGVLDLRVRMLLASVPRGPELFSHHGLW